MDQSSILLFENLLVDGEVRKITINRNNINETGLIVKSVSFFEALSNQFCL